MAGIEKIIGEIEAAADKEAKAIVEAAQKKADEMIQNTENECRDFSSEKKAEADKKAADLLKRYQSQSEQESKLAMLKAKQEVIDEMLAKALDRLKNQDAAPYFEMLLGLLKKAVSKGSGELLLSEKDLGRLPADFEAKAKAVAAEKGGDLVIAKETAKIDGGFILKYGLIEENYSLDSIFEDVHDTLQDTVNRVLW